MVRLNQHKLMKKLSIDIFDMSSFRAQKTAVNYTISCHDGFAKEKILGRFGRSKSDIPPAFENLLSHLTRNKTAFRAPSFQSIENKI